jgi:hypothetical protein
MRTFIFYHTFMDHPSVRDITLSEFLKTCVHVCVCVCVVCVVCVCVCGVCVHLKLCSFVILKGWV